MLVFTLEHKGIKYVKNVICGAMRFYASRYSYGKETPVGLKPQIALFQAVYKFAFFSKLVTCWIRFLA